MQVSNSAIVQQRLANLSPAARERLERFRTQQGKIPVRELEPELGLPEDWGDIDSAIDDAWAAAIRAKNPPRRAPDGELYDPRQPRDKAGQWTRAGQYYRPHPGAQAGAFRDVYGDTGERGAGPPWVQPESTKPPESEPGVETERRQVIQRLEKEQGAGQQVLGGEVGEQALEPLEAKRLLAEQAEAAKAKRLVEMGQTRANIEELRESEFVIVSGDPSSSGHVSNVVVGKVDDGPFIIVKQVDEGYGWAKGEEASYLIAEEFLGRDPNGPPLVPVSAVLPDGRTAQHMMSDGSVALDMVDSSGYLIDYRHVDTNDYQDMVMLDIITGNGDRHMGNIWIDEGGGVTAIDNDSAFAGENYFNRHGYDWGERGELIGFHSEIYEKLEVDTYFNLSPSRLARLRGLADDDDLKAVVEEYGGDWSGVRTRINTALQVAIDEGWIDYEDL